MFPFFFDYILVLFSRAQNFYRKVYRNTVLKVNIQFEKNERQTKSQNCVGRIYKKFISNNKKNNEERMKTDTDCKYQFFVGRQAYKKEEK